MTTPQPPHCNIQHGIPGYIVSYNIIAFSMASSIIISYIGVNYNIAKVLPVGMAWIAVYVGNSAVRIT